MINLRSFLNSVQRRLSSPFIKNKDMRFSLSLVCLFIIALMCSSCGSDNNPNLTIEDYITQNNLVTQTTASGLQYIIKEQGTAPNPTLASAVTINYNGYFLGGGEESFDANDNIEFPLRNLIAGWQEGLQLIGSGGSITLLIPSNLAYGSRGSGSIPGNTDIGFDIDLISHR